MSSRSSAHPPHGETVIEREPHHEGSVGLFIDGRWRDGATIVPNLDPAIGAAIGGVQMASPDDVEDAIAAAAQAQGPWWDQTAAARGAILRRAATILLDRIDEVSEALMLESGKTQAEAVGEIRRAIETLRWNGEEATRLSGWTFPGVVEGSERVSSPTPVGVVVAITAWNYPVVLLARKIGAALAAGCTLVVKASEHCPRSAALVVDCLRHAGLPPGVVNLVFGEAVETARLLLESPHTKALTFTGSTAVGRSLAALAGPRLVRCVMELGGHAPVLVDDDANVPDVIRVSGRAKFEAAGQSCMAPTRYLVHRDRYDELCTALTEYAQSLVLGHGSDPTVTMGALIHPGRVESVTRLTEDAVDKGARLLCGGFRPSTPGAFFAPTVLSEVPDDANLLTEEPFGPIAAVIPVESFDEAIQRANSTSYGLAAYVFTNSVAHRHAATRQLAFGNIGVNQAAPSLPDTPLGGLNDSGFGYEGGRLGVMSFLHYRLVSSSSPPVATTRSA